MFELEQDDNFTCEGQEVEIKNAPCEKSLKSTDAEHWCCWLRVEISNYQQCKNSKTQKVN